MTEFPLAAVLTGDLIASRDAASGHVDKAMDSLEAAARAFGNEWETDLRFTRFRGDGWQVFLEKPWYVLDAIIFMIARLKAADLGIDTRVAAGIGAVNSLGTDDLSDADGEAFYVSGDLLDSIKSPRTLEIGGEGIGIWQRIAIGQVDCLVTGWTAAQAEAVAFSMSHKELDDTESMSHLREYDSTTALQLLRLVSQDIVAKRLGITRQAVQARLAAANTVYLNTPRQAFFEYDFGVGDT